MKSITPADLAMLVAQSLAENKSVLVLISGDKVDGAAAFVNSEAIEFVRDALPSCDTWLSAMLAHVKQREMQEDGRRQSEEN